ncbi:MAG: tetratricopeptide repeat protein, partial [Pirellulaceae bacterium]|nr:tetratricopeptide repeat protein [Pirellulaceae bacterium]
ALQLLTGVANSLLVYACGRRLFDERTALAAGLIAALYGPLIFYECLVMKTFLSPLLTMLALYGALRCAECLQVRWLVASGASVGLACLVRENHVLLMVPLIAATWFHKAAMEGHSRQRRWLHVLVLATACGIPLLATTIRNYIASSELVVVTAGGGEVFYLSHGPQATGFYTAPPFVESDAFEEHEQFRQEAKRRTGRPMTRSESSRFWFREGLQQITRNPLKEVRLLFVKTSAVFNNFEIADSEFYRIACEWLAVLNLLPTFGWIAGLAVLGIAVCLRSPARYFLPLSFVAAHFLSILLLYVFGRFRMGMIPVLILFAARGMFWCIDRMAALRKPATTDRTGTKLTAAAVMILVVTVLAYRPPFGYHKEIDDRNAWIRHYELAMRVKDYARAEVQLHKMLEYPEGPGKAHVHNVLGQHYEKMGRHDEARRQYRQSLEIKPDPKIWAALGFSHRSEGDLEAAVRQFRLALKLDSSYASAHYHLGDALVELNKLDEAAVHLNEVAETPPFEA